MPLRMRVALAIACLVVLTATIELSIGRLPFGPDGRFGWWEGNIWSQEQSQRFADPYSLTHIEHGLLFYAAVWLVARRAPASTRLLAATAVEAIWEVLENSPVIIDRYRVVTISLGYVGDSVLNSCSDVLMMLVGYAIAARARVWTSVAIAAAFEIALAWLVRDNLALNILMLVHPVEAVRTWQMMGQPH